MIAATARTAAVLLGTVTALEVECIALTPLCLGLGSRYPGKSDRAISLVLLTRRTGVGEIDNVRALHRSACLARYRTPASQAHGKAVSAIAIGYHIGPKFIGIGGLTPAM